MTGNDCSDAKHDFAPEVIASLVLLFQTFGSFGDLAIPFMGNLELLAVSHSSGCCGT